MTRSDVVVAALAGVALGSLFLSWHNDYVPLSLDTPWFAVVPVSALATWTGWGVAWFDGLILMSTFASLRGSELASSVRVRRVQCWIAAVTIITLCTTGAWWVAMPRPDLELRMKVLTEHQGPPLFAWWWLRWEFAFPVIANVCLLIVRWRSNGASIRVVRVGAAAAPSSWTAAPREP